MITPHEISPPVNSSSGAKREDPGASVAPGPDPEYSAETDLQEALLGVVDLATLSSSQDAHYRAGIKKMKVQQ